MNINDFVNQLRANPESIAFTDTMSVIAEYYDYVPVSFKNGDTFNESGTNEGSCKLFAFAQAQQLSQEETLACFGDYYRKDVLEHPAGSDHANIRNFIKYGWAGIEFNGTVLSEK